MVKSIIDIEDIYARSFTDKLCLQADEQLANLDLVYTVLVDNSVWEALEQIRQALFEEYHGR